MKVLPLLLLVACGGAPFSVGEDPARDSGTVTDVGQVPDEAGTLVCYQDVECCEGPIDLGRYGWCCSPAAPCEWAWPLPVNEGDK